MNLIKSFEKVIKIIIFAKAGIYIIYIDTGFPFSRE